MPRKRRPKTAPPGHGHVNSFLGLSQPKSPARPKTQKNSSGHHTNTMTRHVQALTNKYAATASGRVHDADARSGKPPRGDSDESEAGTLKKIRDLWSGCVHTEQAKARKSWFVLITTESLQYKGWKDQLNACLANNQSADESATQPQLAKHMQPDQPQQGAIGSSSASNASTNEKEQQIYTTIGKPPTKEEKQKNTDANQRWKKIQWNKLKDDLEQVYTEYMAWLTHWHESYLALDDAIINQTELVQTEHFDESWRNKRVAKYQKDTAALFMTYQFLPSKKRSVYQNKAEEIFHAAETNEAAKRMKAEASQEDEQRMVIEPVLVQQLSTMSLDDIQELFKQMNTDKNTESRIQQTSLFDTRDSSFLPNQQSLYNVGMAATGVSAAARDPTLIPTARGHQCTSLRYL